MNYFDSGGEHFKQFADSLSSTLEEYGKLEDGSLLDLQRSQLEKLMGLETQFRDFLIQHRWGEGVYKLFIDRICIQNGNILTSRPYFRERQDVCIGPISQALDQKNHVGLYRFNFNFLFVQFVLQARRWPEGSKLRKLAVEIKAAREHIVKLNMPLAISQARVFWSKAPARTAFTHLTFMDFVQIACDGLLSAVDKFVPPSAKKFKNPVQLREEWRRFRPMMCQRMVGNFIESYSETMVHFYPKDKRKLYRANKYLGKNSGSVVDFDRVTVAVNRDAKGRMIPSSARTTSAEISNLLSAASNLGPTDSSTNASNPDAEDNPLDRYASEREAQPDNQYEKVEVMHKMNQAMQQLSVFERKLLRLKGIAL